MSPNHIITNTFPMPWNGLYNILMLERKSQFDRGFRMNIFYTFFQFFQFLRKRKLIFPLESFKRSWKSKTNLLPPFKNSRSCNLLNHVGNLMAIIHFYNWATIFDWRKSFTIYEARLIFHINLYFSWKGAGQYSYWTI